MNNTPHKRRCCRRCGDEVDVFCSEDNGLWISLETQPLPITTDLNDHRYELYELGPTGWSCKFTPAGRNWREIRKVHKCRKREP